MVRVRHGKPFLDTCVFREYSDFVDLFVALLISYISRKKTAVSSSSFLVF